MQLQSHALDQAGQLLRRVGGFVNVVHHHGPRRVVDLIDGAARAVVMYDIHETTDPAKQLAGLIQRMALQLHEVVSMLQKPKGVTERLVELHRLEHEGDDIYQRAVGGLFHETRDPLTVIKWKDVYEKLEAAIDRCENVANIIEGVIIKHS